MSLSENRIRRACLQSCTHVILTRSAVRAIYREILVFTFFYSFSIKIALTRSSKNADVPRFYGNRVKVCVVKINAYAYL